MKLLVLDGETAMRGQAASDWAEANSVELKFKAPDQKAWTAERHQELLRQSCHTTESQLQKEGIHLPFEQVLAMVTFAHNALVHIGRHTPYQGLYGRQPALLPQAEGCTQLELTDEAPRPETQAR